MGLTDGLRELGVLLRGVHGGVCLEAAHVVGEVGEAGAGGLGAFKVLAGQSTCNESGGQLEE